MALRSITASILAALLLAPGSLLAITDDEVNTGVQFNFSNPGARSLALGGAFTALADDATAAYANPAGLTILRTQEFGLEVRHTGFDTPFADGGRLDLNPFRSSVSEGTASASVTRPSFVSWVYPTEKATYSLYYHRLGDFRSRFSTQSIEIFDNLGPLGAIVGKDTRLNYQVVNLGAAVGFKASDQLSLGFSLLYSDFSIDSVTERRVTTGSPQVANRQRQNGSDSDLAWSLGLLWRFDEQWSMGLAYRHGGDFRYRASNEQFTVPTAPARLDFEPEFRVPHVLSVGLAFKPNDHWTFSFDANRVRYSRLSDNLESIFNQPPPPLAVRDGTELRLGAEYAFLDAATPFFVRAGVWRDPDHRLAFRGAAPSNCTVSFEAESLCLAAALYPKGSDETHFSFGLGWSWSNFQLDVAGDFSDLVDTYSVSGVFKF